MKIAFLSFYSGEVYRGVETFVHEVANRLADLGHEVVVFQNGPKLPGTKYKVKTIGLKIDWERKNNYIPFINYWERMVGKFTLGVLKILNEDTDILFPTNGQWQTLLSSLWARFHKAKLVISGQSGPGLDDRMNIWFFPDVFLGLTDFQFNWAKKVNPFVKISKIPNGVDTSKFVEGTKPVSIDLPRPIVLAVAALDSWKRLDLAVKAVSKLEKGSLLLIGRGGQESKLIKLAGELLPSRFKIMSFPHKDMPKVYQVADIFTYPASPRESFGIVLVEAMASGLPVVATKDPIRKEIVGNAGILVDPGDTNAYAKALEKALGTNWGNKPREQAEKFSWDEIANSYEKLFKELK